MVVFGFGAMLAGFAGAMVAPILSVEPGMGDNILILAFVVIVIGGIGSIRGAFLAALLIGLVDTVGRSFAPNLLRLFLDPAAASQTGRAIAPMLIYIFMAAVLFFRPSGLFPGEALGAAMTDSQNALAPMRIARRPAARDRPCIVLFAALQRHRSRRVSGAEGYVLSLLTRVMIFGIAAMSLDLILGYGALVSFGHAAFLGIGGLCGRHSGEPWQRGAARAGSRRARRPRRSSPS